MRLFILLFLFLLLDLIFLIFLVDVSLNVGYFSIILVLNLHSLPLDLIEDSLLDLFRQCLEHFVSRLR